MTIRGHNLFLVGLLALAFFLFPENVMAQADLTDGTKTYQGLLSLIKEKSDLWDGKLRGYALNLFWGLAGIQLVWTFFPLVFKQADFGELVGELIRFIMVIGFFLALLLFATEWGNAIVDSFREAGASAAGLPSKGLTPGKVFGLAIDLADMIGRINTWNPATAFMLTLASLVILLCFAFIAAFLGITLIESYIVINASVLFMGFGGSQWTREFSIAILRYAVSVGAKLFVLTLLVGLIVESAKSWQAAYTNDSASMWTMVGLSLVCAYFAKTIPEIIQGLITGTSTGGGGGIGAMAAVAVAAAATAGAAAAAGGAAGAAGGASGAAGGSGLASSLGSSMAGGSGVSGAASTASGTAGASASAGNSIGGAANATSNTASGASNAASSPRIGGGAANNATSSDDRSNAPASASGSSSDSQSNEAAAPANETSNEEKGGNSGIKVAEALTRGAGMLSALSVPGMEGSAALSLNAPPPGSEIPNDDNGPDFSSPESSKTDESPNVIRPADPAPKGE